MDPLRLIILRFSLITYTLVLQDLSLAGNVTLISLSTHNDGREGFWWTNPAYDVIVQMLRISKPHLLQNFTHIALRYRDERGSGLQEMPDSSGPALQERGPARPPPPKCEVGNVSDFFFNYYFQHLDLFSGPLSRQFTIITTADCDQNVIEVSNFLPDTNSLFAVASPVSELSDNVKFPTTLNMFSMPDTYFVHVVAVLAAQFKWSGVNLICNTLGGFNWKICETYEVLLQSSILRNLGVGRTLLNVSREDTPMYNFTGLRETLVTRRVIGVLLEPDLLRRFMVIAFDWNMTNGDYVFFAFGISGIPRENAIFYKLNQPDDAKALLAFRSLLIIADSNSEAGKSFEINERVNKEFKKRYNLTQDLRDQDIETPVKLFELFSVFAETYQRVYSQLDRMTIQDFVDESSNETYNLSTRMVYLDSDGVMRTLINILRLDVRGSFQIAMICDLIVPEIDVIDLNWYGLNRTLPSELPPCGLDGEKCLATREDLINIGIPIICVGTVLLTALTIVIVRGMVLRSRLTHLMISCVQPEQTGGLMLLDPHRDTLGLNGFHNDRAVYVKEFVSGMNSHRLTHDMALVNGIVTLSLVHHPYLAEFHGILIKQSVCSLVYERPGKGSLDVVFGRSEVFRDLDIRLLAMNCLIQALHFIHTSDLKYHGALGFDVCLLDHRYTLRVAQAGFVHLLNLLDADFTEEGHQKGCRPCSVDAREKALILHYQKDDIKKFGLIMATIFDINPYGISTEQGRGSMALPIRLMLEHTVSSCLSTDLQARPTSSTLVQWINRLIPPRISLVDLLIDRLQKHAESLEQMVELRTMALLEEMRKVDDLLLEMLPRNVITRLRNNERIVPEVFESVTILFSDIPAFGAIVSERKPMEVVWFLNQLHSSFDTVVEKFDAYKVETINDSYVVSSGVPVRNGSSHAGETCRLALQLLMAANQIHVPGWDTVAICPRIGINSGFIAAGVAGTRAPRYCLFGDTMNTASRMESHGAANKIHVSYSTYTIVQQSIRETVADLVFIPRGLVAIKSKGNVETFWLRRRTDSRRGIE